MRCDFKKQKSHCTGQYQHIHKRQDVHEELSFQPQDNMGDGYKENDAKTSYYVYFQLVLFQCG